MNTLNKISRITVLVSLALLALSNTDIHAQTSVSGNQTGVWTKAGSPYLVVGSVTVPSGDSLRIEPGVVVNVEQANFAITVRGTLNAIGTAADSILITSNKPTKAGGQWNGIEFSGGQGTLDYCVIEAGGSNIGFNTTFGIRLSSSAISLSHSAVRKIVNTSTSLAHGLWVMNNSSATVTETRIEEVEVDGIRVDGNAAAIVTRCEIRNNGNDGLEFSTSGSSVGVSSVTATNIHNNAGYGVRVSSSGKSPEISGNVISGNGVAALGISGTIDQNMTWDVDTDLLGNTTLSTGRTLTIAPGVVVEGIGSTIGLTIQGNLMAVGSVADSIVFTSDDAIKAGGQWRGITISGQGTFDYCVIEAAGDQATGTGSAITTSGAASLTLRRSTIYKISNTASGRVAHGFWLSSANSVGALADVRINEVQADGFRQESSTSANLTAVSIFSCGGNGIFTDGTLSRVRNSRVIGNNRGIHIARGTPNLGTLTDPGFNAIYNNADFQLYNATTNTISAQNNFWVAIDSATIDARIFDDEENSQTGTTGIAIFSPWLNQEPSPENLPPVAEAGPNQTVGENVVVTLDGRTSRDPENAPLTFAWTQTAGPAVTLNNPNNAVTTFTTPTVFLNQTLTFRLQVSDGMLADMDLVTVTVLNNINESPVAHAGPDQTVAAGVLVTLDGTGSSDPNNQTLTFQWTQISGVAVTLNNPAMAQPTFIAPSIVTGVVLGFQLQVSDGALAARDTVTITVLDRPTLVTFNLDMRPLQRLGLFRPEKGMRPLVNFFGSNVQQNALLSDSNADSVWSAPVLQPGGATARYAFALDPNGDGLNPSGEWVFELDSLANNVRSLVVPAGRDTVLPVVLFDNVPSQAIAPNYAALVTRNFRPGDSPATVFDEPSEQSFVTLDFSTLNKGAVVAIRRYGTGPGGDLPSGIAVLAKNVYWGIEASPTAANFSARLIINYDPLNGIVDPNALRLLRRNSPQAQWQVIATELNALAKTLTATNVSSIGEWTLGSTSTVNPLEPQPPGLVSKPNPPDGEAQVFEKPRLSWLAAAAGRSYDLFLWPDTGKSPATPTAANLTGPSFQIVNALPFGAKFKWQVIAKNIDGATASLVWSFTVQTLTDLQVTAVNVPNEAFSGQSIEVSWVVTNNSTAPTDAARWFDQVYLSANPVFNSATATSLGQFENVAFLPAGEGYTNTKQFTLPQGIIGNYYIFVATDVTKRQRESNDNNNITRSPQPIKINLTPPPDLQVTRILSPDNAFSGNRIDFSYTVTNKGPGTTGMFEWFDAIFFSKDLVLNANAQQLGSGVRHVGVLDPDSSYTIRTNVIIPKGAQGPSYLFVATDVTNQVFEFALESNNVGRDSIHITLTPPPDLVVKSVTIAASAASGDSLTVDWTVENPGPGPTTIASISDRIHLSRTAVFSADSAIVLGSLTKSLLAGNTTIVLNPGDTYDQVHRVKLPDGVFGNLYVFVQTDWNNLEFEHNFEINNFTRAANPISTNLSPWADLRILSVLSPDSAAAGEKITIDWTGTNSGIPLAARASWVDRVYVATDSIFDPNRARLLVDATKTGPLDSTTTYTQTRTVDLPVELSGKSYIYVQTDATNRIFEHVDESNNVIRSRPLHVRPYPVVDLAVTALTVPDTGFSGRTAAILWTVTNVGQGRTLSSNWVDEIYLSRDTSLQPSQDILLERVRRSQTLAASQSYSRSFSGKLPHGIAGDFYVIIKADADEQVTESNRTNNLRVSATPVNIVLTPAPDLQVITVSAPTERNSGQPATVKWTVQNTGIGVTEAATWFDVIYLSANTMLDATDLKLTSFTRSGVLQPNQSYTDSLEVDLPTYVSGAYNVLVSTDNRKDIFELDEENNTGVAAIFLTLPPPSDLVATNITMPASAMPGEEVTVTYTLQNLGANPAVGFLNDAVFFSADTIWTIDDPLLGIERRFVNIPPGGVFQAKMKVDLAKTFKMDANTGEITEELPGLTPGKYHAIVRTDIKNNIRENDEANNTSFSASFMNVEVPMLPIGVTVSGRFDRKTKYFRVDALENLDLLLKLTSDGQNQTNEVYVAFDRVPSPSDFDHAGIEPFSANQQVLIPTTKQGNYYVMLNNRATTGLSANFALRADSLAFEIISVESNRGGNTGSVTIEIRGSKFEESMSVSLRQDSTVFDAYKTTLRDATRIFASFNLIDARQGFYDLILKKSNQETVILSRGFEVLLGGEPDLSIVVRHPASVRGNQSVPMTIEYTNSGTVDLPLSASTLLGFSETPIGLSPNDFKHDLRTLYLIFTENEGPDHVL